jgi:tetratricopeptide (TPR) repeat protein
MFFAPKIFAMIAHIFFSSFVATSLDALGVLCLVANADAADAPPAQAIAAAYNDETAGVVVFDNAYLDRRFGHSRRDDASKNGSRRIEPGETAHAFGAVFETSLLQIAPNGSLLKGITRRTSARRAAGLRLAEHGRQAFEKKQYQQAIHYLEKALSVDATPFVYFYLARAHYQMADYPRSLQFLEVAESAFHGHAPWMAELARLKRSLSAVTGSRQEASGGGAGLGKNQH